MDAQAIRKLQKYGVKIEYDPTVKENRGYVFTPSSIDGSIKECLCFQLAIQSMVNALEHNTSLIRLFQ